MQLKIQTEAEDETLRVTLGGEFDAGSVEAFRAAVAHGAVPWRHLTIDMRDVAFMDSTALGALVRLNQRAREQGLNVALMCPSRPVMRLLELTGLEKDFTVRD